MVSVTPETGAAAPGHIAEPLHRTVQLLTILAGGYPAGIGGGPGGLLAHLMGGFGGARRATPARYVFARFQHIIALRPRVRLPC